MVTLLANGHCFRAIIVSVIKEKNRNQTVDLKKKKQILIHENNN